LLTEYLLKASGQFKTDSMFLIKKGVCAEATDFVSRLEGEIGHAPECVAYIYVDVWKQTLVIRVGITQSMIQVHVGF